VIKSNGNQVKAQLEKDAKSLVKGMQKVLQLWGNKTIREGKKQKPYKRRSGNLDRAQKAKVQGLGVVISIDEHLVTKDGFNYGAAQHDGTKYIKGEPWLEDAVDARLNTLVSEIADMAGEVLK